MTDWKEVPPGQDQETLDVYSRIKLTFNIDEENLNPFKRDLGTGLKTGDQVGCAVLQGLTTVSTGRISCYLYVGTGPTDFPYITIYGYDAIPPYTSVKIQICELETLNQITHLGVSITNTIWTSIEVIYKKHNNIISSLYEPAAIGLPVASVPLSLSSQRSANSSSYNPSLEATPTVYTSTKPADERFSYVKPSKEIKQVATSDEKMTYKFWFYDSLQFPTITSSLVYIALQFPSDFFNRFPDNRVKNFPVTSCNIYEDGVLQVGKCTPVVFPVSNVIYVRVGINLLPSKLYLIEVVDVQPAAFQMTGNLMVDAKFIAGDEIVYKQQFEYRSSKVAFKACNSYLYKQVQLSSTFGRLNNVTYTIQFIPGHIIPSDGALSILFDDKYVGNLFTMNLHCNLTRGFGKQSVCRVGNNNRLDIVLYGYTVNPQSLCEIKVTGLNSPVAATSKLNIISYYDFNIYRNKQICNVEVQLPTIEVQPVRTCEFLPSTEQQLISQESQYKFLFKCLLDVRQKTTLYIRMHRDFLENNNVAAYECQSLEPGTLADKNCHLMTTNDLQPVLKVQLRPIPAQTEFTLLIKLKNPNYDTKRYNFTSTFYSYDLLYLQGDTYKQKQVQLEFLKQKQQSIDNKLIQATIFNQPINSGELATYILRIPPMAGFTGELEFVDIVFPPYFQSTVGSDMECGIFMQVNNNENVEIYKDVLKVISQKNKLEYQ